MLFKSVIGVWIRCFSQPSISLPFQVRISTEVIRFPSVWKMRLQNFISTWGEVTKIRFLGKCLPPYLKLFRLFEQTIKNKKNLILWTYFNLPKPKKELGTLPEKKRQPDPSLHPKSRLCPISCWPTGTINWDLNQFAGWKKTWMVQSDCFHLDEYFRLADYSSG